MSEELWGNAPDDTRPDARPAPSNSEEQRLLEKLVMSLAAERRRSRRWGIFFKFLTFAYLTVVLVLLLPDDLIDRDQAGDVHVALIDIQGAIAQDEAANADAIVTGLRNAFDDPGTQAVIMRINSPGGSPVQAGYVYDEVKRLRALHPDTPVYSVVADIGASGGYYIAAAADEIYADKASLVGSIGVISSSFGFVDTLEKLGVERRLVTSGENKAFLDPFSPLKKREVEFWKGVLDTTHRQFIEQVKLGRGERLANDPTLFTGLIWTGEQALELGLVDGLGSASYVAREVVGEERLVNFTQKATPLERFVERFGASFGRTLAAEFGVKAPLLR